MVMQWCPYCILSYVTSWIDTRHAQSERANLTILFDKYVPYCLEQVRCNLKTITPIPENSMVQVRTHSMLILCLGLKSVSYIFTSCLQPVVEFLCCVLAFCQNCVVLSDFVFLC